MFSRRQAPSNAFSDWHGPAIVAPFSLRVNLYSVESPNRRCTLSTAPNSIARVSVSVVFDMTQLLHVGCVQLQSLHLSGLRTNRATCCFDTSQSRSGAAEPSSAVYLWRKVSTNRHGQRVVSRPSGREIERVWPNCPRRNCVRRVGISQNTNSMAICAAILRIRASSSGSHGRLLIDHHGGAGHPLIRLQSVRRERNTECPLVLLQNRRS